MELKILQGNNLAESSDRAADDDLFNEVLDRYVSKDSMGNEVMKQSDMKEAVEEIYEKKKESDPFKAQEQVAEIFPALWQDHAVNDAMEIDRSEAYTVLQDVAN